MSKNLDRKDFLNMADGGKLIAKVPLSWKESFSMGVVSPQKMKNCTDFKKEVLCANCDKIVNQKEKFSAKLNEIKRGTPNEFGHMRRKYVTT